MHVDFWNNPLVVSTFRVKYRRSSPAMLISAYLLALVGLAGIIEYYRAQLSIAPGLMFLGVMLSIQFYLSAIIAIITVSSSMNSEVANRTFDYQRIVSLSPREILVGKMIGEPTLAYFMLLATIPLAMFCYAYGSTTAWVIFWFYVNLISFTLMCASLGLLHTLKPSKKGASGQGGIGATMIFPMFMLPMFLLNLANVQSDTWIGALINLLTPIGPLMGLFHSQAFEATVPLWNWQIPTLYIAPLANLLIVSSVVAMMAKRLSNPSVPLISRVRGYLSILVFDVLQAGILYSFWSNGDSVTRLLFVFGFGHVVASLLIILFATPSKPALLSWIWRFENQSHWLSDLWTNNRAMINGSLVVMCLIGSITMLVGLVLPIYLAAPTLIKPMAIVEVICVSSLLVLALGICYQRCLTTGGSSGVIVFLLLLLIGCIIGPIISAFIEETSNYAATAFFRSTSPLVYYMYHMENSFARLTKTPWPLLLECGFVWALMYFSMNRWLYRQRHTIHKKVASMGIS